MSVMQDYFTLWLTRTLCADLNVVSVNNIPVFSRSAPTCIDAISGSTLSFSSYIDLPTGKDVMYQVSFKLGNRELSLMLNLTEKQPARYPAKFQYKGEFQCEESEKVFIASAVNHLQVRSKSSDSFTDCRFCSKKDRYQCLKQARKNEPVKR